MLAVSTAFRYNSRMSTQQLKEEAMSLSLSERVAVAQALWESIDATLGDADERASVHEAVRRDQELSAGAVAGRTHEQVVQAARRAIECD
jgi:putative addiction module component (TIGR02574 family)